MISGKGYEETQSWSSHYHVIAGVTYKNNENCVLSPRLERTVLQIQVQSIKLILIRLTGPLLSTEYVGTC
jgi:hypothetical protein